MDPIDFMSETELRAYAREIRRELWRHQKVVIDPNIPVEELRAAIREEDGSAERFSMIFRKRPGWWVIHNILAHGLIGVMPVGPFFKFHDYTARKLRGGK